MAFLVSLVAFQEDRNFSQYLTTTLWSRVTSSSRKPGSISYLRKNFLSHLLSPIVPDGPRWPATGMDAYETKLSTWKRSHEKKHAMKSQYTIHMQSRPVLEDIFPRLLLLAPFSTLTPFNLKTHLIHARLSLGHTVLTFPVFFHIS